MSRRKIANLERDLEIAESDYKEQLFAALKRAASGHWGLLGSNQQMEAADRATAIELLELGDRVRDIRAQLGITDPFELHQRFIALRRECRESKAIGEPMLAGRFLKELEGE